MRGHRNYKLALVGVVLLMVLAGGVAWLMRRDRGPAARIRQVVLISIDTCRSDHLGCYTVDRQTTPHIDEVAQHATLFQNVISPVPLTLPAHSSMLTGTNPTYHDVHDNFYQQLAPANLTLAEVLHGNGFVTGAIVSASVLDSRFGLDQGFDEYLDRMSVQEADDSSAKHPAARRPRWPCSGWNSTRATRFSCFSTTSTHIILISRRSRSRRVSPRSRMPEKSRTPTTVSGK